MDLSEEMLKKMVIEEPYAEYSAGDRSQTLDTNGRINSGIVVQMQGRDRQLPT